MVVLTYTSREKCFHKKQRNINFTINFTHACKIPKHFENMFQQMFSAPQMFNTPYFFWQFICCKTPTKMTYFLYKTQLISEYTRTRSKYKVLVSRICLLIHTCLKCTLHKTKHYTTLSGRNIEFKVFQSLYIPIFHFENLICSVLYVYTNLLHNGILNRQPLIPDTSKQGLVA